METIDTQHAMKHCTEGEACRFPACACSGIFKIITIEQCKRCHTEVPHTTSGVCDKCKARERGNV